MYLPRKCSCWNLARLCVGGVMCMDRGVTRMLSKTTLRPHHIAGVGRDRFVVSKHVFGFFELTMFTCVGGSMWGSFRRSMASTWPAREHYVLDDWSSPSKGNFFIMHKVKVFAKKIFVVLEKNYKTVFQEQTKSCHHPLKPEQDLKWPTVIFPSISGYFPEYFPSWWISNKSIMCKVANRSLLEVSISIKDWGWGEDSGI